MTRAFAPSESKTEVRLVPYSISAETEYLVKTDAIGVCSSDVKEYLGVDRGRSDFGHEFVGHIVYSRPGSFLAAGDRVVLDPNAKCVPYRRSSGFADYVWIESSSQTKVLQKIDETFGDHLDSLTEPLACAFRALAKILELISSKGWSSNTVTITIIGCGPMGLMIAHLCQQKGFRVKFVTNKQSRANEICRAGWVRPEIDAVLVGPITRDDSVISVLCTPEVAPEVLERAIASKLDNSAIILYGSTQRISGHKKWGFIDGVRRSERTLDLSSRITVSGVYGTDPLDFSRSIDHLGNFRLRRLFSNITELHSLCQLPILFRNLSTDHLNRLQKNIILI